MDAIEVGRIVDAWGLKGWVKVQAFAADPQALFSARQWFLLPSEKAATARLGLNLPFPTQLRIVQVKEHGEVVVALSHEVADRAGAEALRGARVFVGRASFPSTSPDEFYWVDLIGLQVLNRDGTSLGTVTGLIDTGPHSVLQVTAPVDMARDAVAPPVPPVERLIPFVGAYIDDVSLELGRISVDWGLDF
jgi:16S rRNA processing protein RimM